MIVGNAASLQVTLQHLLGYGWSIHYANNAREAMKSLNGEVCKVGLIIIAPSISSLPLELDYRSDLSQIQWVAIIDRDALQHDKVRDLIYNACYAYQALPIDVKNSISCWRVR